VGLTPTGKRRLTTAHAVSSHSGESDFALAFAQRRNPSNGKTSPASNLFPAFFGGHQLRRASTLSLACETKFKTLDFKGLGNSIADMIWIN